MNKPTFINLRPFLTIKAVELNGILFSNKDIIQSAIYMSPTITDQLLSNEGCNSIVCSINTEDKNIIINFMSYTKERNLLIKDFRYNGLIEQDVYDEQICEVNSSCYDSGIYTFILTTGFLMDNFDLRSKYDQDRFVVFIPLNSNGDLEIDQDMTIEEFEEEMENFENSTVTETIIIPFDSIEREFEIDPEIL